MSDSIRRDYLRRRIERGELLARLGYHYDQMTGVSKGTRWKRPEIVKRGQWTPDNVLTLYPDLFEGSGRARKVEDGEIRLTVHNNLWHELRETDRPLVTDLVVQQALQELSPEGPVAKGAVEIVREVMPERTDVHPGAGGEHGDIKVGTFDRRIRMFFNDPDDGDTHWTATDVDAPVRWEPDDDGGVVILRDGEPSAERTG